MLSSEQINVVREKLNNHIRYLGEVGLFNTEDMFLYGNRNIFASDENLAELNWKIIKPVIERKLENLSKNLKELQAEYDKALEVYGDTRKSILSKKINRPLEAVKKDSITFNEKVHLGLSCIELKTADVTLSHDQYAALINYLNQYEHTIFSYDALIRKACVYTASSPRSVGALLMDPNSPTKRYGAVQASSSYVSDASASNFGQPSRITFWNRMTGKVKGLFQVCFHPQAHQAKKEVQEEEYYRLANDTTLSISSNRPMRNQ